MRGNIFHNLRNAWIATFFALLFSLAVAASQHHVRDTALTTCRPASFVPSENDTSVPRRFGFLLYRATDPLDFLGPSEVLFTLGRLAHVDFYYIVAESFVIVSTELVPPATKAYNSTIWTSVAPTHTYDDPPIDLDALVVPGGPGARAPSNVTLDLCGTRPNLKYFVNVYTGTVIAAEAGLLDGRRATTNRAAWLTATAAGPSTTWVGDEKWVVDGNVWTSSGVAAGIDAMVTFIARFWGEQLIARTLQLMADIPTRSTALCHVAERDLQVAINSIAIH
ncbi:DJ-1 protein/PfpI family protein [Mycena sanguinolenta]|uniref:DJ-1 protein/PfpI family protein n=1 Tax=Mycena sanguinolenta TaxID=230812 RepID=A0A8H6YXU1_9AGAR|nr:DJ-1 protein/PfpI family protein [Mycena sanguinolenta]